MKFFILNAQLAQKIIIPLYFLVVLGGLSEQWIARQIQNQLAGAPGAWLYLYGFFSLIFSLLFPSLLALILGFGLKKSFRIQKGLVSPQAEMNQLLIETTRSWGQILGSLLLLIVPGLIRYLQLIFVPYVVLFSKEYSQGRRDALRRSSEIFHKNLFRTLAVLVVLQLFLPALISAVFQEHKSYLDHPFSALAIAGIDTLVVLFLGQGLFLIFQKESEGELSYE